MQYGAKYIYDGEATRYLPEMAEGGKVRISVGFPDDIYEKLAEIAKKHHRTVASVVVKACDRFLKESETRGIAGVLTV